MGALSSKFGLYFFLHSDEGCPVIKTASNSRLVGDEDYMKATPVGQGNSLASTRDQLGFFNLMQIVGLHHHYTVAIQVQGRR